MVCVSCAFTQNITTITYINFYFNNSSLKVIMDEIESTNRKEMTKTTASFLISFVTTLKN